MGAGLEAAYRTERSGDPSVAKALAGDFQRRQTSAWSNRLLKTRRSQAMRRVNDGLS